MFTKHVSLIDFSDIEDLINVRKEREGYHLDFKGEFGNPDKAKKELAKDISAFANSDGGFLIVGIDKNNNIVGIERTIQNKPIDEWINQILNSNVEPQVFYFDPKIIPLPNNEKILVVIHIPESTKKPHMVTEWNNYFIRVNDSSKSANHSQVRDMFEISKRRSDEFIDFIIKRNLKDEDHPGFGQNKNSKILLSEVLQKLNKPAPLILYSLFPKYPNEEKIKMPFIEFLSWLQNKSRGYQPLDTYSLYHGDYRYDLRIDGVVLKNMTGQDLSSYFEVLNNGYVEAGFSNSFISVYPNLASKLEIRISLTPIIVYEMMLLGFAKQFYEFAHYYDEVMIQLSFVNVLGCIPWSLNSKYNKRSPYEPPSNKQHSNFKLTYRFNPKTLTDAEILQIAKLHSEQIGRAFGLNGDYCFVDDKLSLSEMRGFDL